MDSEIRSYPSKDIGDGHRLCYYHGIVYQDDTTQSVEYAEDYFENYKKYESSLIADRLNKFRVSLVDKYIHQGVLDIGIGCGTFLSRCGRPRLGYDINPNGVAWLKEQKLYFDPYAEKIPGWIEGVTLWDVLEHMPNPDLFLERIRPGMYLFTSIPMFTILEKFRESKHYKPGEHLTYWTRYGLVGYLDEMGFEIMYNTDEETKIGRSYIETFVFRKK